MWSGRTQVSVVVIGAGCSGIATGAKLKSRLKFDDFVIFEREKGLGGTWYTHRYPGCGVDIPSFLYSFSFARNRSFSKLLPKQPELLAYVQDVAERFDVVRHIQLGINWESAVWNDTAKRWIVNLKRVETGETFEYECKVLIASTGALIEPEDCNVDGSKNFKGKIIHTARWDPRVELEGKRVGVIGNGPSAAQLIPAIQNKVRSIHQFQRTPQHYFPCHNPSYNWYWFFMFSRVPFFLELCRYALFNYLELTYMQFSSSTKHNLLRFLSAQVSRNHTKRLAPAEYLNLVTPTYTLGCKRRVLDNGYLKSLHREHIHLTDDPVSHLTENGIVTKSGTETEIDILVLATGYKNPFAQLNVMGKNGVTLQSHWSRFGGEEAYQSVAMANFPNFFFIYGPNATPSHTSALVSIERYVDLVLTLIKPILSSKAETVEVDFETEKKHCAQVQSVLRHKVWTDRCSSRYVDEKSGWNSAISPYSSYTLWYMTKFPDAAPWLYDQVARLEVELGKTPDASMSVEKGAVYLMTAEV